jgi:LPXTG-motif cell wall-anchored protein
MKQRIGGLLAIMLGVVLMAFGATGNGLSVGQNGTLCGGLPIGIVVPTCPTGHIVITKVVVGSGTAPAGGWVFTITSTNCTIFPGSSDTVTIPAAGGTVASDELYSSESIGPGIIGPACNYHVTEAAAAGWTTTYSRSLVVLGTGTGNNDEDITVTNTGTPQSSTPPPTSAAPSTPAASASPTDLLANTGGKHVKPTFIAGILLVLLGGVMLFMGRKPRHAQT